VVTALLLGQTEEKHCLITLFGKFIRDETGNSLMRACEESAFIRAHNEALFVIAMPVNNADRLPFNT
jgi:hypothetical protein